MRTESRRAGWQKYLAGGPFVLEETEDTPVHPDPNIIKYLMIPPLLNMILVRRCCELRMLKGGGTQGETLLAERLYSELQALLDAILIQTVTLS